MPKQQELGAHQNTKDTSQLNKDRSRNNYSLDIQPSHPAEILQRAKLNMGNLSYSDVMQLQRSIGNQAAIQLLRNLSIVKDVSVVKSAKENNPSVIQLAPSDFKERFGKNKLMNPSSLQMLSDMYWYTYILQVKPYFNIDDKERFTRLAVFPTVYTRAKSIFKEYSSGFGKEKQELGNEINSMLEEERLILYDFSGMDINEKDPTEKAGDPTSKKPDFKYGDQSDPLWSPLFTQELSVDDVQQGNLGDCYLLAAVASIVNTKPSHFLKHMMDNLDGTVTVKLYNDDGLPINIIINKSAVGEKFAQKVLWVKMLEKAYAAAGFKGSRGKTEEGKRSYESIEGGDAAVAMTHLTGKKTENFGIGNSRKMISGALMDQLGVTRTALKKRVLELQEIIKSKEEKKEKVELEQQEFDTTLQRVFSMEGIIGEMDGKLSLKFVSVEDITQIINKKGIDPELVEAIKKVVGLTTEHPLLPGTLGSGKYGLDEMKLYEQIKKTVDAGQPVTVCTKNTIEDTLNIAEKERGHSAGEAKVNGLVSKHEYSVLDYSPKVYAPGNNIMIKIRNPWGQYERKYIDPQKKEVDIDTEGRWQGRGVADNDGKGIFWIDIADMVAFFERLSFTQINE